MQTFKAREKGLTFATGTDDIHGKKYEGDPTRIRQILINLCGNAIKFTEQGSVKLEIKAAPSDERGYEEIYIFVTDTGIGIPKDKLEAIFEKFTQADASMVRKYGGTGLGLAITKRLAELMGGDIQVESALGYGTTFRVHFPLALKSLAKPADNPPAMETPGIPANASKGKVLLVEDYKPNALVAGTFLEEFGYDYDIAGNGREAVQLFMENEYQSILMDVQMPDMDGYEATRAIRQYEAERGHKRTLIIGLTAHVSVEDREKSLAAGMDDFLSKPFEPHQMEEKLGQLRSGKNSWPQQ